MRIESGSLEITGLLDPDSPHCSSTAGFEKIHGRLCCGEESEGSVSNRRAAGAAGQILPEAAHGGNTLLPLTPGSPQVEQGPKIETSIVQYFRKKKYF